MSRRDLESRRFPRVSITGEGAVTVRAVGTASELTPAQLPDSPPVRVRLQDLSPAGAGIIMNPDSAPSRRDRVTLHLSVNGKQLDIPARVAWKGFYGELVRVGLSLELELASAAHRRAYAEWIVDRIRRELR